MQNVIDQTIGEKEEWRAYRDGTYEVSNLGRVRRVKPAKAAKPGMVLKPRRRSGGYFGFALRINTIPSEHSLHRMVAETFLGLFPEMEVNHRDGNKANNRLDNLEYVTREQNIQHSIRNNLFSQGEKHYRASLTAKQVREIKRLSVNGYKQKDIASQFNVRPNVVSDIVRGAKWKSVQ